MLKGTRRLSMGFQDQDEWPKFPKMPIFSAQFNITNNHVYGMQIQQ